MKLSKILSMAWESLTQRRLRSSLTTLGVVVGVATIISLAALGEGFRVEIKQRMQEGFELDVLIIIPGSFATGIGKFTPEDVEAVRNVSGVELATPIITIPDAKVYTYEENATRLKAFTVSAVNFTEMLKLLPHRLNATLEGEIPSGKENDTIVLGYKTCVFNDTEPIVHVGDNVTVQITGIPFNLTFRVAAILEKSGTSGLTNFDYWAFIPLNTIQEEQRTYNLILAKVDDPEKSEEIARSIENNFDNPYSISILVPVAFMREVDRILGFIQLFLTAIATISLLVAGIGIMNIMTVSVMERTREIGILKAIGAKSRTVLALFLSEALLVGVIGGVIGIFAGYGLSYGLAYSLSRFLQPTQQDTVFRQTETQPMELNPVFPFEWILIAFLFAILVCIIFGLYPARKAAKLDPVKALRYE
ncbi:hypothetical protein DRO54_06875 [Candidatus Bathyarchaeota archaeon]|nr:MAG: hypothetical protein DRO54_06875 [Candidatus Bathyarchaeota archaeon]